VIICFYISLWIIAGSIVAIVLKTQGFFQTVLDALDFSGESAEMKADLGDQYENLATTVLFFMVVLAFPLFFVYLDHENTNMR
jgi:hypothetical protein